VRCFSGLREPMSIRDSTSKQAQKLTPLPARHTDENWYPSHLSADR
jgi:hypothetical protein